MSRADMSAFQALARAFADALADDECSAVVSGEGGVRQDELSGATLALASELRQALLLLDRPESPE